MIAFRINGEELDLEQDTSLQVEYFNPLFEVDRIPGLYTLPATLPWSKKNERMLGFPGQLSVRSYRKEPFACELYLNNLWKTGKLHILGTTEKGISVNFQGEVGDLGEGFKNDSLRDLPLGSEPLAMNVMGYYPEAKYALFPVKNAMLYGEQDPDGIPVYSGYVNYFDGAFKSPSPQYPCTPFPYLVHVMRQVMKHYGYTITGPWPEREDARRLVVYNTQALDSASQQEVVFANHLPDMKVNEFMKAVRAAFGLAYLFNPTARTMEVVSLKEVIEDNTSFADWRGRITKVKEWKPNDTDGFRLEFSPDDSDELNESLPAGAYTYQVGRGKEVISINLGTLNMAETPFGPMPQASQERSADGGFGLSLLYYSNAGTPHAQPLVPATVYGQCHQSWLQFLGETEHVDTEVDLNITDLRTLRPERKVMVQAENSIVKALWKKISVTISLKDGVKAAKAPLLKVRV